MYGIARTKRALNAWCWRVNFRRRNKLYAKQFFDLKHGGSKPALEVAIAWRDRTLALVAALIEARMEGMFYSEKEWRRWRKHAP